MSYLFGVGKRRLTRAQATAIHAIAVKHDTIFFEANIPGTGYQWWFACANLGSPFNERTAYEVMTAVHALLGEDES